MSTVTLLNCVISYNRYLYLRNTVDSLREYLRLGDLLILDDGSDDPALVRYLDQVENQGAVVIRKRRESPKQYHGGLYELMNEALEYALSNNYTLVNFVQDDMQFLWHDPDILDKVLRIFLQHNDALQVQNLFQKKLLKYHLIEYERIELHPETCSYHFKPYGVCDLGFFLVERVRESGFRYLDSEGNTANYWRAKGFRLYGLHAPTLAFIPWPYTFHRGRKMRNWLHPSAGKATCRYYLTPLDNRQIANLLGRPLADLPFLEDYSRPWGWRCLYPFWYTRFDLREYVTLLLSFWRNGEFLIPRLVAAKSAK